MIKTVGIGSQLLSQLDVQYPTTIVEVGLKLKRDDASVKEYSFAYPSSDTIVRLTTPVIATGESYLFTSPKLLEPGRWTVEWITDFGYLISPEGPLVAVAKPPENSQLQVQVASELPMYFGVASSVPANEADVLALPHSEIRFDFAKETMVTAANQVFCVSHPVTWGLAEIRFVDGGMPIVMEWTVFEVGGVLYRNGSSAPLVCSEMVEVY